MEKLLIIGGSGFLGSHLIKHTTKEFEVVATYNTHPFELEGCKSIYLDITDRDATENTVITIHPDLIILCSAQRNLDHCESNPEEARRVNVTGVRNVACAAGKIDRKLIYLSTDMVFDGAKERYVEDDATNPLNYYGKTKLEGEKEVANTCDDFAIARVSVLYDWNIFSHTANFVAWIYRSLKEGKAVKLYEDQFRNATYVQNVYDALMSIYRNDEKGVFHVAGKNLVSRYYIGQKVAEIFSLDGNLITPCSSDEADWVAKRPKKCSLNVDKMEKRLGVRSMRLEEGLAGMKEEMGS